MPVFDLANAQPSTSLIAYLRGSEKTVPFVYGDGSAGPGNISLIPTKQGQTPVASDVTGLSYSGTGMENQGYYNKEPLDPSRHYFKNGAWRSDFGIPTFGVGNTVVSLRRPKASGAPGDWGFDSSGDIGRQYNLTYQTRDRHWLNLYEVLHDEDKGISINDNGTWKHIYFPIEHDLTYATNSTGGGWIDTNSSGTDDDGIGNTGVVKNSEPIPIRYTGDGTSVTRSDGVTIIKARPSQEICKLMMTTHLDSCAASVKDAFYKYDQTNLIQYDGYESWAKALDSNGQVIFEPECFPYDSTIAQLHFDIMCDIVYHKGGNAFKHSWFVQTYKYKDSENQTLRQASSITSTSDLVEYKEAMHALLFCALMEDSGRYKWAQGLVDRYRKHIQSFLTATFYSSGSYVNGVYTINSPAFGIDPNPLVQGADWYQGYSIHQDFYYAPDEYYFNYFQGIGGLRGFRSEGRVNPGGLPEASAGGQGLDPTQIEEDANNPVLTVEEQIEQLTLTPLPPVDFWTGKNSAGAVLNYEELYSGQRSIYDTDTGDPQYYLVDPNFQAYYSKYWQDASHWFHGATASSTPRAPTKHGAVLASTQHNSLPSFMFGLNENGAGESKVYIRSSTSPPAILSGVATDDCFDIANGKTMGTIDYGQWNHFAITREGDNFYTFKNGVMQDTWTSNAYVKIPQPDTKLWLSTGLDLSIGRSQGADFFYGYLDGLRITKGTAKHTRNNSTGVVSYTVPTSAPTSENISTDYDGTHYLETVLSALNRVATQLDIEWKVRIGTEADNTNRPIPSGSNEGKLLLDMGPKESLFVGHGKTEDAKTIVVRGTSGEDPSITGLDPASIKSSFDASEYVSTVEYVESAGSSKTDALDVTDENVPYKDLHGYDLERVVYAAEPQHPHISKEERARAFLKELKRVKRSIDLDLDYYDIQGDFEVGDNIFVYDPDLGFEDNTDKMTEDGRTQLFEVSYQGQYINPEKIRVTAITHPIQSGMGVYLRRLVSPNFPVVQYIDLTPYISFEQGGARLEVGDLPLKLGDDLRFSPVVTGVIAGNKVATPGKIRSITNYSTHSLDLTSGVIQDALGQDQAIIKVKWAVPTNDDGSIIANGELYRIRYRKTGTNDPYTFDSVTWGTTQFTIEGLALGTNYEVGVIAINSNGAQGDYVTGNITTAVDTVAPTKPGPADTIAAGALRVQITHSLGKAEDAQGNPLSSIVDFTLESDVDHLNVYASTTSGFTVNSNSLVGNLPVTASHIRLAIPVVGEIQMPNGSTHYFRFTAVDKSGNESGASTEQSASGNLVATANISDAAITEAKIDSLAVTTAKIADAAISNAKIGDIIQSDNYSPGNTGWTIEKQKSGYPNGYAEFSDIVARGNITATTGAIGGWDITSNTIAADVTSGGQTYSLTLDANAGTISGNFVTGTSGFKIEADGSVEFNDGVFRGDISGATGTFSGGINIGNGTFVVNSQGGITLSSIIGFHIVP